MPTELLAKPINEEEDNVKNSKRRQVNTKFATDKFTHSLRRDLLVSNFDKTMTVEKARFEPIEEPITTQSAPAIPTLIQQSTMVEGIDNVIRRTESHNELSSSSPPTTYALTMSPSAPILSTTAHYGSNGNTLLTSTPLVKSPSVVSEKRRLTPIRSEGNQNSNTNRKKQSSKKQTKPTMHGTASPAEVFHRNLVDAVSNVEDSDENEHYVYPYSGNESSNHHVSDMAGMHRPLSVRSTTPVTLLNDLKKRANSHSLGDWLKRALFKNTVATPILDEEEEDWSGNEHQRRPKLRNTVKEHRPHQNPSTSSLLSRWHDSFKSASSSMKNSSRKKRAYPPMQKIGSQQPAPYYINNGIGGYTSDEEDAPLLSRRQQKRVRNKKQTCKNIFRNSILSIISIIGILFMIIMYRSQPLMEINVDIGRVLATDKELIFDLKVEAENWNWWTIHVADADISVFAYSQIVPSFSANVNSSSSGHTRGVDPAEYLGNLIHFDEPLSIPSSLFNKGRIEAISQIRIKSPGADASGNERWSRMIRYPYGLVVRGVLKYKPIPLVMGMYPQSTAVCNVTRVDPTTGAVSADPDRTICAGQDESTIFSRFLSF